MPAVSIFLQPKRPNRKEPLIQDSAGGRKAEGSRFLQNTSETVVVAASGGKIGIFDIPSARGQLQGCRGVELHRPGRAGSLPRQPSSPVFCSALFLEFYESLMLWKMAKQRERKSHSIIL